MNLQSWFLSLQKTLIPYKKLITRLFLVGEIIVSLVWLAGGYLSFTQPELAFDIYEFGRRMGELAIACYLTTLVPGILSRLQQPPWTLLGVIIQPYRRHFGILTFLFAFTHMSFTTGFPALVNWQLPVIIGSPKLWGILALTLIFPLWITSNDVSQKTLGRKWKWIHRLTYIALFMVFLHLAYFRKRWIIPTMVVMGAELFSWLLVWVRKRQAPSIGGSTSAVPPQPPTETS